MFRLSVRQTFNFVALYELTITLHQAVACLVQLISLSLCFIKYFFVEFVLKFNESHSKEDNLVIFIEFFL